MAGKVSVLSGEATAIALLNEYYVPSKLPCDCVIVIIHIITVAVSLVCPGGIFFPPVYCGDSLTS